MRRKCFLNSRSARAASVILALLSLTGYCAAESLILLDGQLAKIRHSERAQGIALADLEKWCLSLIVDHNSPSEKGRVYATVAAIYGEKGYDSPDDPRIAKTIIYAAKALEHPLDVLMACEMYGSWSGAIMAQSRNYTESRFSEERPKALLACLKGLKLALDNGAPQEPPQAPQPVAKISVAPGIPGYERLMAEHKQQVEAREKWEFLSKLYIQRWALTHGCITLYTRRPYDTEEFVAQATKVLVGHDDVVRRISDQIQERITSQMATQGTK